MEGNPSTYAIVEAVKADGTLYHSYSLVTVSNLLRQLRSMQP